MTNKNGQKATLTASLDIECPNCHQTFDLFGESDGGGIYSRLIFNNNWDDLAGEDVFCPECDHEFTISSVKY